MRTLAGELVLPSNVPSTDAATVLVEVREVSRQDVASTVVAEVRMAGVRLRPGASLPFRLLVPEADPPASLSVRAHVSRTGASRVSPGDLLTTASHPIPGSGELPSVRIPVEVV